MYRSRWEFGVILLEERRRRCIFVAQSKGLRDRGRLRSVLDTRPEGSLWFALIVTKQKCKWSSGHGVFEGLKGPLEG